MAETWSGEFYCVKCKEKREAEGEIKVNDKGTKMAKGVCPVCGELVDGRDPRRGHLVAHRVAHRGVVEGQQDDPLGRALEAQVGTVGGGLWHGPRVLMRLSVEGPGFTLSACGA